MVVGDRLSAVGDFWREVLEHIRGRGRQTIASCVGISWGIFIMVVLVGVGNAFQDGVMLLFRDFNSEMVRVNAGVVSEPAEGGADGVRVRFDKEDIINIRRNVSGMKYVSPLFSSWANVSARGTYGNFEMRGCDSDYLRMMTNRMAKGRDLNVRDFREGRRCAIIGENVADVLFKRTDCIGKKFVVNDMPVTVVGVFKSSPMTPNDARAIFVPSSCYLSVVDDSPQFSTMVYVSESGRDIAEQVRRQLGFRHRFKPTDPKAVYVVTMEEQLRAFDSLFGGIRYFLWFVGISTLVGGVVGISNIMVSNVRERTREIGVRMALGATPESIKGMILGETMLLSASAGAGGVAMGWLVLGVANLVPKGAETFLGELSVDMGTTVFSLIVILLSGLLSGLRPAHIASTMNPIKALQTE